jgi:cell division protein FtsL
VALPSVAPAEVPPSTGVATRRRAARPRGGALVTGGVVWIVLVALLLGGIVAVNVAVLRLNVDLTQLGRDRAQLQARNARLESQLSSAGTIARVQAAARKRLGLVPADPSKIRYIFLRPRK